MQLSLFGFLNSGQPNTEYSAPINPKYIDRVSDPMLKSLWLSLRKRWFPQRPDIDEYIVRWSSRRQKRTLGSCNIHSKKISIARELNYREHHNWLEPLLYHEMCHAFLGDSIVDEDQRIRWHGKEFKQLEKRHPGIDDLNDWIDAGGWARAVRSDRAKRAHLNRKSNLDQRKRAVA